MTSTRRLIPHFERSTVPRAGRRGLTAPTDYPSYQITLHDKVFGGLMWTFGP